VARVALTFDTEFPGRPTDAGAEERILAALAEAGARATFFLQGRWVRGNPEQARRIADAGHLVGNHSNYHAPMDGLTDELLRRDVRKAEATIRETTGVDPRPWFRCPFGAGGEDERVLAALSELGYRHVGWDVDPFDWEEERTPEELEQRVREGVRRHGDGAIVLLHAWPRVTAERLPALLDGLREDGANLVAVDELGRV
jgi:peptidoglycan/xylan/chitin deacetylase (PgdA/CDA1 family)